MSYGEMVNYKNEIIINYEPPKFGKKIKFEAAKGIMGKKAALDAAHSGICCTCAEVFYCGNKGCGCYSCTEWKISTDYDR